MNIKVGSLLKIKNLNARVTGYINYRNPLDGNKTWTEYRLDTPSGERWLSYDEIYQEYSISRPDNSVRGKVGPEWHKVDSGYQIVTSCGGDVDVERGDQAEFVEFEDASEDKTLSVETWDDGTEYSRGEYIELGDIQIVGYEKPKFDASKLLASEGFWTLICILFMVVLFVLEELPPLPRHIDSYLKNSVSYEYVTSITGNARQKADVYEYKGSYKKSYVIVGVPGQDRGYSTDEVARDIIDGIEGQTESVTQQEDGNGDSIAIVTKKEYCLIYHPEDDPDAVYVQISKRKYNYASDNSPYKSSGSTTHWYRSHYYSSSYSADSSTFKSTPSAYTLYNGDTIHNIGNGYFDNYSSSVRQSSINARRSSSGGGK